VAWSAALILMLGTLSVLLMAGLPVAFAFIGIDLLGAYVFLGGQAGLDQMAREAVSSAIANTFGTDVAPGESAPASAAQGAPPKQS